VPAAAVLRLARENGLDPTAESSLEGAVAALELGADDAADAAADDDAGGASGGDGDGEGEGGSGTKEEDAASSAAAADAGDGDGEKEEEADDGWEEVSARPARRQQNRTLRFALLTHPLSLSNG